MTIVDFADNGAWDCQHAIDKADAHEAWRQLGYPRDARTVARALLEDVDLEDWIAQQDGFDGLGPIACFTAWSDGWTVRATAYISEWMSDWRRD